MSENPEVKASVATVEAPSPAAASPVRNKYSRDKRKRKMPKVIKVIIPLILVAAIVTGVVVLVKKFTKKDAGNIITGTVSMGTLSDAVTGWGSVSAKEKAEFGAKNKGTIITVDVVAGQKVATGDLLYTIDPTEIKDELVTAKKDLSNMDKQREANLKQLKAAEKALNDAKGALGNASARAPFTGKLIAPIALKEGQAVTKDQVIGKLVDDSEMTLTLSLSRGYIDKVKVGQQVSVSVSEFMTTVLGTVTAIDDIEKPVDGTVCFTAHVTVKNPGAFTDGTVATGVITGDNGEKITPVDSGKMTYSRTVDVLMPVAGTVSSLDLVEFKQYTAGSALCTIGTDSLLNSISEAQTAYDRAYETVSGIEAQKTYDALVKKITNLETEINTTEIRSTINGMVSGVMIKPGDKLSAGGTAVVTVSNTDSMLVNINIDEIDIAKVKLGMNVDITSDGGATSGELTYVSFEAKGQEGGGMNGGMVSSFPATITLAEGGSFLPGMSVNYTITSLVKENCPLLPSQAIVYTESGTVVFVKEGDTHGYTKVELPADQIPAAGYFPVAVEIGLADATNTEVIGLEEGTEVYVGTANNEASWG